MVSAVQGAIPGARLSAAQRREQFLDVAAQLVVEQGADAVTMEAVAARAGVSKALSYRYFDNAGALLVALFEREVIDLDRKIMASGRARRLVRGEGPRVVRRLGRPHQ